VIETRGEAMARAVQEGPLSVGVEEEHMFTKRPLLFSVLLYVAVAAFLAYKRATKLRQTQG